jgi:next to BRCA1 gene 1 protein
LSDGQDVVFERYSDSASSYVKLDSNNTPVYKTLLRAAKAKGKLRIRATVIEPEKEAKTESNSQTVVENEKASEPNPEVVATCTAPLPRLCGLSNMPGTWNEQTRTSQPVSELLQKAAPTVSTASSREGQLNYQHNTFL